MTQQPMSTVRMYNNDFDLFTSHDAFASIDESQPFAAKAPTAFSNAFGAPHLRAVDDAVLESPLGLSPLSLASSSPFDASFADDLSPMITGTPDLIDEDSFGDMPSLFHPWPSTEALPSFEPQQQEPKPAVTQAPATASPAAVSPLLMTLDNNSGQLDEGKEPVEARIARARQVAQQVLSEDKKPVKDKFTGTRNTSLPMIDMNAPTMSRSWVIPAATSRKRAPSSALPASEKPTKKRAARGSRAPSSSASSVITPDEAEQIDELPDEVLTAIELKRRQNTLAARRSRQRKANHLAELQSQIDGLQSEVEDWKAKCAQLEDLVRQLRGGGEA